MSDSLIGPASMPSRAFAVLIDIERAIYGMHPRNVAKVRKMLAEEEAGCEFCRRSTLAWIDALAGHDHEDKP